jgi:hypothetical protein
MYTQGLGVSEKKEKKTNTTRYIVFFWVFSDTHSPCACIGIYFFMYIDRNSRDCDSWYITCILIEIQETVIHGTLHVY